MPLRAREVSVERNGREVVSDVSLDLQAGTITGLFGPSGCGKTTLALALTRLLSTTRGEITGGRTAIIFQDPLLALNPVMRVRDQIGEVERAHGNRTPVADVLRLVSLDPTERLLNAYPHQLSGGERQRVTIAQALASRPEVIIADEPFTALDAPRIVELSKLFSNLRDRLNTGLLLISHSPGVLAHTAELVLVMENGRIVERGVPASVFGILPKLPPRASHRATGEALLTVRNVTKQFGAHIAVKDVSLTLTRGTTLALVGSSGCGKSTLARCIAGFEQPTSGEIVVNGPRPQMILQQPGASLNPRFTAADAIEEPLCIAGKRGNVPELLQLVGLPADCGARRVTEFSGGERQRIAIARGLALKPEVLILDESFSGLDLALQVQIADLLNRLDLTYLWISHDLEFVGGVADEIAVMDDGAIVEAGPAASILGNPQHPRTRELVEASRALAL